MRMSRPLHFCGNFELRDQYFTLKYIMVSLRYMYTVSAIHNNRMVNTIMYYEQWNKVCSHCLKDLDLNNTLWNSKHNAILKHRLRSQKCVGS